MYCLDPSFGILPHDYCGMISWIIILREKLLDIGPLSKH